MQNLYYCVKRHLMTQHTKIYITLLKTLYLTEDHNLIQLTFIWNVKFVKKHYVHTHKKQNFTQHLLLVKVHNIKEKKHNLVIKCFKKINCGRHQSAQYVKRVYKNVFSSFLKYLNQHYW